MVASIHQQREVLDSLEAAAAEADQRIGLAERRATKLEENKAELELEIAELRRQRDGLTENIDQDKLALNKSVFITLPILHITYNDFNNFQVPDWAEPAGRPAGRKEDGAEEV